MTLEEIKRRASKEEVNIINEIETIKNKIEENPDGIDLNFDRDKIDSIILYCSNNNIPAYNVAENTISVAKTYTKLITREQYR